MRNRAQVDHNVRNSISPWNALPFSSARLAYALLSWRDRIFTNGCTSNPHISLFSFFVGAVHRRKEGVRTNLKAGLIGGRCSGDGRRRSPARAAPVSLTPHNMATVSSLAPETLELIFSLAVSDPSSTKRSPGERRYPNLLSFSLVSAFWSGVAQPLLYRYITVEKQLQARLLAASAAFGRHRVSELVLLGNAGGGLAGVDNYTARVLVARAGEAGLESLALRLFYRLDTRIVQLAGPSESF